jgi:flagellar basal body-associated protein FliL
MAVPGLDLMPAGLAPLTGPAVATGPLVWVAVVIIVVVVAAAGAGLMWAAIGARRPQDHPQETHSTDNQKEPT